MRLLHKKNNLFCLSSAIFLLFFIYNQWRLFSTYLPFSMKCSSEDVLKNNKIEYLDLENNETVIALKNVCIFNSTIEIFTHDMECKTKNTNKIFGFVLKFKRKEQNYIFIKKHVALFIDAYPVIENLHHFIKDFCATLYSILLKGKLFTHVTNRYVLCDLKKGNTFLLIWFLLLYFFHHLNHFIYFP